MIASTCPDAHLAPPAQPGNALLNIRIRAGGPDSSIELCEQLPPVRHRRIHVGMLHDTCDGLVEVAGGHRPPGGKMKLVSRRDPQTYAPGGGTADDSPAWLDDLLAIAARHVAAGKEVCVAPAVRHTAAGNKQAVSRTKWLWIDVDGTDGLPAVRELLRSKPAQLIVESAGSGGVHCYWRLDQPLRHDAEHDWLTDSPGRVIEAANQRLIYALGYTWEGGRPVPTVADLACKDRSRVMRLAGTVNGKTGKYARIMWADFVLPGWPLRELLGDLPEVPQPKPARRRAGAQVHHDDPYKRIAPAAYFHRLAGIEVPASGFVSCPNPAHDDTTPSCHVGRDAGEGWWCHGCGAGGAIYDLASVLLGGPTGRWLRGEAFRRARARVQQAFGDMR